MHLIYFYLCGLNMSDWTDCPTHVQDLTMLMTQTETNFSLCYGFKLGTSCDVLVCNNCKFMAIAFRKKFKFH